jgi:hypothetical protein
MRWKLSASNFRGAAMLVAAGGIGSVLALVIMLTAPGNAIRQTATGATLPLSQLLPKTMIAVTAFIATDVVIFAPITLLLTLVFILVFIQPLEFPQRLSSRHVRSWLGLSFCVSFILITVCIAPPLYAYAKDSIPPDRVLFLPHVVMIITAAFWGCVMGLGLKNGLATDNHSMSVPAFAVIIVLLIIGPVLSIGMLADQIGLYRTFALESDTRDQAIRNAVANGAKDVKVNRLDVDMAYLGGLDIITPDPTHWVNVCAANYYNAKTITADAD